MIMATSEYTYNTLSSQFEHNKKERLAIWSVMVRLKKDYVWNDLTVRVADAHLTTFQFFKDKKNEIPSQLIAQIKMIRQQFAQKFDGTLKSNTYKYREENGMLVKILTEQQKQDLRSFYHFRLDAKLEMIQSDFAVDFNNLQSSEDKIAKISKSCKEQVNIIELEIQQKQKELIVKKLIKKELVEKRNKLLSTPSIWDACWIGNLVFLKKELEKLWGWPFSSDRKDFINSRFNEQGLSLLHLASIGGKFTDKADKSSPEGRNVSVVRYLLEQGALPNLRDKEGYTALHRAAQAGEFEIAKELIKFKADVNAQQNGELGVLRRPLHMAAYNGYPAIIKLLLQAGADINAQTNLEDCCETPLHQAVKMRQMMCVDELLKDPKIDINNACALAGIEVKIPSTALRYAIISESCSGEMIQKIASHAKWKCPSDDKDPNHPQQLLTLPKLQDQEEIDRILRELLPGQKKRNVSGVSNAIPSNP